MDKEAEDTEVLGDTEVTEDMADKIVMDGHQIVILCIPISLILDHTTTSAGMVAIQEAMGTVDMADMVATEATVAMAAMAALVVTWEDMDIVDHLDIKAVWLLATEVPSKNIGEN